MSDHETSLREMYELGLEHGKALGKDYAEIEQLKKEIGQLETELKKVGTNNYDIRRHTKTQ